MLGVKCSMVVVPMECQDKTILSLLNVAWLDLRASVKKVLTRIDSGPQLCWEITYLDETDCPAVTVLTDEEFVGDDWKRMKFYKHSRQDDYIEPVFPADYQP